MDYTRVSQKFCSILVYVSLQNIYHITESVQDVVGATVVSSIVLVGALTYSAYSVYDLKVMLMNVQHSLIQELILHEFKLCYNTKEATKKICCMKGEGKADHSTITRWFKTFCSDSKNHDKQARSGRPKTRDSEAALQVIKTNLVSGNWRASSELDLSQSSVICHFHNLGKSIQSCRIVSYVIKILQNFWLTWVKTKDKPHHW